MKTAENQFVTKKEFGEIIDREINVLAGITKNGFDRMEAGFREMRGEMNERFAKVDERFDAMQEDMDERFKDTRDLMSYHFDGVNRRIDDISLNYAKQSQVIDLEKRIEVLGTKIV